MISWRINCFYGLAFLMVISGCGTSQPEKEAGPTAELELELVDSLVVDELVPLLMDDHSPELGYYMLRNSKSRQPLLVDENGTVIQEFDILHDGPNGIGSYGSGYRLLNDSSWVAQNLMTGYYLFDYQGNRLKDLPADRAGLFSISIYHNRTTFTPYMKNGAGYILYEDSNVFDHKAITPEELGAEFYAKAQTLINYNISTGESELMESYPESWEPRKSGRFVGKAFPLVAIHRKRLEVALLPTVGNQLFVYDYSGEEPVLKDTVSLVHRFRPGKAPAADLDAERWLDDYPLFTDLRVLGNGYLVGFYTRIPAEVIKSLRAKSEEYYKLPEYKEATEQYAKPYYIYVRNGKQVGVINELPVNGVVDFADEAGNLYVNDNAEPEYERDYNVFFRLRVKE